MPEVKSRSFGVVPVGLEHDGSFRLLILRAFRNWDFPKGGADEDETPLAAATREMKEETGIQQFNFEWGEKSMNTEIYSGGKVATYYLAR